ncbi:MAG: HD domain-containing protein [Chitinophagaceae bacterium]|nr:HD domain-containing protein [Chitinophagaceae bacterium]
MPNFLKAEIDIITRLKNELSPKLIYHSYFHTLDVMNAAMQIAEAENIAQDEISLLRIAIAYHDSGFIELYNGHESKGCDYAREDLPKLGFSQYQIDLICGMIMATKLSNKANNKLEEIISDADLDYLGRFDYPHISEKLFKELQLNSLIDSLESWKVMQQEFMTKHNYLTTYSKENREAIKYKNLEAIKLSQISF